MTRAFVHRREAWLREVQRRTTARQSTARGQAQLEAAQRRRAEDLEALRGVEFRIIRYPRSRSVARPSPRWLASDERDWVDLEMLRVRLSGTRCFVPPGSLITGGERSWRCEVSP